MKLLKGKKKIEVKPKGKLFIFKEDKKSFLNNTPETVKALAKLYNKGWHEGFIDLKLIFGLSLLGFIIIMFFIF